MRKDLIGLYASIIYFLVSFSQLHVIIPGVKYIKLGLLSTIILLVLVMPNLFKKGWLYPLGIWRIFFLLSIIPGLVYGYGSGLVRGILITAIIDFIVSFIGISVFVNNIRNLMLFNWIVIASGLAMAIYVIVNGGHGPGILTDENDAGLVLVMLLPFAYFFWTQVRVLYLKVILLITVMLIISATCATLSRGAMVGVLPTVFIIVMESKRKILTLFFMAIAISVAIVFAPPKLISEFKSIKNTNEGTAGARQYFWGLSIEMFKKKPLFGVGAQCWGNALWSGLVPFKGAIRIMTPHSIYFQTLSELGLLGVVSWGGLIIASFLSCFKIQKLTINASRVIIDKTIQSELIFLNLFAKSLSIGLVGGLICGLFLSFLFYPHIFAFIALIQTTYSITYLKTIQLSYYCNRNNC